MTLVYSDPRPVDLNELHARRHAALIAWEGAEKEADVLIRRIKAGTNLIIEAHATGADPATVRAAEEKLDRLEQDLRGLRLSTDVPAEIIDAFYSLAESLCKKGLPEGSFISAVIPKVLNLAVRIDDANAPPF